jgi:hypothetical protein
MNGSSGSRSEELGVSIMSPLTPQQPTFKRTSICAASGHKRSSRLPHILLVSTSSARPDSKNVLSA